MFHSTKQRNIEGRSRQTHPENCAPTPINSSSCCDLSLGPGFLLASKPDELLWLWPLLACELGPYVT